MEGRTERPVSVKIMRTGHFYYQSNKNERRSMKMFKFVVAVAFYVFTLTFTNTLLYADENTPAARR